MCSADYVTWAGRPSGDAVVWGITARETGNLEKSAQERVDTWGGDRSENKDKRVDLVLSTRGQTGFICSVSSLKAKRWESYKRKTSAHKGSLTYWSFSLFSSHDKLTP